MSKNIKSASAGALYADCLGDVDEQRAPVGKPVEMSAKSKTVVMADKIDDWIEIEYVCEVLDDVRKRLRAGSEGLGATLTPDECLKVLACLKDPPRPNRRPPQNGAERESICFHCLKLENEGVPRARAVAETAQAFGCSKWVVNKARRTRGSG